MSKRLFWIDLEMTGLDENRDHILEVAVVVTDLEFKPLEEYHRVVFQPQSVLDGMNDWCKENHGKSGLTAAVPGGTPLATVEKELQGLVERHFSHKERVVLCGNSVGNDQRFILKYMPELSKRLHYRLIDVSSFKEIFRDKYGVNFQKGSKHRAIDDIHESIQELKLYLSHVKT
jgi:oligoribonuclease